MSAASGVETGSVDLYWLPLGAGASLPTVRWSGRAYEAIAARRSRRPAQPLFHAALVICVGETRFVVEMAPAWGPTSGEAGVVDVGPVGLRPLGRLRFFRYEVRRWQNGVIPDLWAAVGGPTTLRSDVVSAAAVLDAVTHFPTATWGRDDLGVGDMWNSNSLVAFVLTRAGIEADLITPPVGGRAPGWHAGVTAATG